MNVYTIARKVKECYGHGDYGEELQILQDGGRGDGDFPPVFTTKELANAYLESLEWNHDKHVVELEVRE